MSECPGRPLLLQLIDGKLQDLRKRGVAAIAQLTDEEVNWRPNDESNSVVNLVVHMTGNLGQNIEAGIAGRPFTRDRDLEFNTREAHTAASIGAAFDQAMASAAAAVAKVTPADLTKPVPTHRGEVTLLAVLFTVCTHLSEHVGQLMYIAKMKRGASYQTLSIVHKRNP